MSCRLNSVRGFVRTGRRRGRSTVRDGIRCSMILLRPASETGAVIDEGERSVRKFHVGIICQSRVHKRYLRLPDVRKRPCVDSKMLCINEKTDNQLRAPQQLYLPALSTVNRRAPEQLRLSFVTGKCMRRHQEHRNQPRREPAHPRERPVRLQRSAHSLQSHLNGVTATHHQSATWRSEWEPEAADDNRSSRNGT